MPTAIQPALASAPPLSASVARLTTDLSQERGPTKGVSRCWRGAPLVGQGRFNLSAKGCVDFRWLVSDRLVRSARIGLQPLPKNQFFTPMKIIAVLLTACAFGTSALAGPAYTSSKGVKSI